MIKVSIYDNDNARIVGEDIKYNYRDWWVKLIQHSRSISLDAARKSKDLAGYHDHFYDLAYDIVKEELSLYDAAYDINSSCITFPNETSYTAFVLRWS